MLVNCALRPPAEDQALNVEIGHRLILTGPFDGPLDLYPPNGTPYRIEQTGDAQGRRWISEPAEVPGIYVWKQGDQIVAYSNVQYPAAEADLEYRTATEIAPASRGFSHRSIGGATRGANRRRLAPAAAMERADRGGVAAVVRGDAPRQYIKISARTIYPLSPRPRLVSAGWVRGDFRTSSAAPHPRPPCRN